MTAAPKSSPEPKTSGWVFEEIPPMGGATGNAFSNTLQGTGSPSERLVREAIQNSTDAGSDAKVRVRFRYQLLAGAERAAFLAQAEISDGFGPRQAKLGFDNSNVLTELNDAKKQLGLLYIEDYQTWGLRGELSDDTSDFHRLLLTIGDDQKAVGDQTSGGSYGYGKAVLSSNSRIRTIFAYSLARENGKSSSKLLGCAYGSKHDHDDARHTGRAWLGAKEKNGVVAPFTDEDAHSFAARLGFAPRRADEFGTSILIVDCTIDMKDLRRDTETYWWPRLLDDELEVEFLENGTLVDPPRPKQRPDLLPFIECYEMAVGRAEPVGKHQTKGRLNRAAGNELGRYAFEVLVREGEDADGESTDELTNRIAVMRNPKMVVAYLRGYTRPAPDIVGVFVADGAIDQYLKLSEPPDHTAWLATSGRLAKLKHHAEAGECIRAIHDRLRRKAKDFQATALPPPPKKGTRLTRLEKALGAFFRTLGDGPEPGKEEPVEVSFVGGPTAIDVDRKRKAVSGEFEIKLKTKFPAEEAEATIEFEVPILEDGSAGDVLPLKLTDRQAGSKHAFAEGRATITKVLKRNESYRFEFSTGPYDRQWSTSPTVKISITPPEI